MKHLHKRVTSLEAAAVRPVNYRAAFEADVARWRREGTHRHILAALDCLADTRLLVLRSTDPGKPYLLVELLPEDLDL